ncbi:MAG: hypothetical protein ACLP7Q_04950, partial [Isosphaeraceae bacterium]
GVALTRKRQAHRKRLQQKPLNPGVRSQVASHHACFRVRSELLSDKISNLLPALKVGEEQRPAVYAGYVSGEFLDETVNAERTGFVLPEQIDLEFSDVLSWQDILDASIARAAEFLAPFTRPTKESKEDHIRAFVRDKKPQYRSVVKHHPEWLDEIAPNLPEEKLDLELYKLDRRYDMEVKQQSTRFLAANPVELQDTEDYSTTFQKLVSILSERGTEKLSEYVAHRKAILAILDKRLEVRHDGRYPLEESIHTLVFPLRKTSDDVKPDQMNLWIIDERLAYHFYLASDVPLKKQTPVQCDSASRPDILVLNQPIFDRPIAFSESGPPLTSIVIIEFKRPLRNDYDDNENPISQVYKYVSELKAGKVLDHRGRPINISPQTPFYAYIICDLTENLREQAKYAGLTPTPDALGFFGWSNNFGTYVEIISFEKLVTDAKKRNAILFEKLGLGG